MPRRAVSLLALRRAVSLLALVWVTALALSARADFPSVNVRRFSPPVDPAGSLYLEPTPTPGPFAFNGAVWLGYAYRPAVLRDPNGVIVSPLLKNQLSADLVSNIGLGQRFALGFDLPIALYQNGDDDVNTRAVAGRAPPAQALGDLAFYAKGNIVAPGSLGGFGLSTLLRFSAPTGSEVSYLGEGTS